jgi:hypothetical protein
MIQFRQKQFTEYDAMRTLYERILKRTGGDKNKKFKIINSSALIPILKGNNVVVEKFTISTSVFGGRERYRMYIKIGARAKLPDEVRLPSLKVYDVTIGKVSLRIGDGLFRKSFSEGVSIQKEFGKGGGGGGSQPSLKAELNQDISIKRKCQEILGEAIEYSKTQRSLVLEFKSVDDAIEALNYLPFGLNYQIYLLDA